MSFQLRALLLFRFDGQVRRIDLKPASLNIITGASKTGKSSVIDIIDYCLGSSGFNVAAGVIRESVDTFGIILQLDDGRHLLLTRPRPPGRQTSTNAMHLRLGDFSSRVPNLSELAPNTDAGSVRTYLSNLVGIRENLLEPA